VKLRQVFSGYDRQEYQQVDEYRYCPFCSTPLQRVAVGGKPRAHCPNCGFTHFKNPAPTVSVVILDGDHILLGRRSAPPGEGRWAFPSGYIEWEDDFLSTAIRETKEETGLEVELVSVLNVVSSFWSPRFHFLSLFVSARVVGGDLVAGDDLLAAEWFSLLEPLPDLAFEEDRAILEMVRSEQLAGLPVDADFALGR
jgi:8-oxo-dGTP diphosphatase